jgi:alpha-beta hydrolase superfamily lysophospholipase
MGESDKPFARYTTAEMARDVVDLLDSIGWTGARELHIVGNSLGGMIAQELVRNEPFSPMDSPPFSRLSFMGEHDKLRNQNHCVCRRFSFRRGSRR